MGEGKVATSSKNAILGQNIFRGQTCVWEQILKINCR